MSNALKLVQINTLEPDRDQIIDQYLAELSAYLVGILPTNELDRILEETGDHLDSMLDDMDQMSVLTHFGDPRTIADQHIEAWFIRPSRLGSIERVLGPGTVRALAYFGMAAFVYWSVLQFRVFLPSNSAFHLPWSPGQIRKFFPEPLPFPDFSFQFLLMAGIPLIAPPILGWMVGKSVPIRPQSAVYNVLMPMILVSFVIGVLLLPITDGLVFAILQCVYWLPVGCGFAWLAQAKSRRERRLNWLAGESA